MYSKCLVSRTFVLAALVLLTGFIVFGQEPAAKVSPAPSNTPVPHGERIKRWFEMDTLSIGTRFRHITTNVNIDSADILQFQLQARGRFKFDKKGKYSVSAGVYTGSSITSGWGNTGLGTGGPQTNLYVKQLFFTAKPIKQIEINIGSIAPYYGENTEITAYDNDAFFMGERLTIRAPKNLYFDEINAVNGHLGDVTRPSVFHRFKRLDESNYHQLMVRKRINKSVAFSADYTFEAGRDTFRQGVKFSIPRFRAVDSMRFENYQRVDPEKGYGFAISGEKTFRKKLNLNGGFARIDTIMFNADRFPRGNRLFAGWNLKMTRELTLSGIWIQGVGPLPTANTPRTRVDVIFAYNILETLKHFGLQ